MFFIGVCMRDTPPHPILHCMPHRSGAPLHASTCTEIGKRIKAIHSPHTLRHHFTRSRCGLVCYALVMQRALYFFGNNCAFCVCIYITLYIIHICNEYRATTHPLQNNLTLVFPMRSSVFITIPIICINGNVYNSTGL